MGRARTIYGALAAVVLLAVGVPILVPSMATLVTLILAKSIVVLGIIILLQAGQVSFGHAMFFAAGAYTAGFWGRYLGVGDLVGYLLVGTVVATVLGLLVGLFVVRYREIFFGMLNLAFSMVLWSLLEKMFHYTNGADGIRIPRPRIAGMTFSPEKFEFVLLGVTLAIAVAATIATQRYLDSPRGHMLGAIKTNETRLEYLGISAKRVFWRGYALSAGLCGLGGSVFALTQGLVTPEMGYWVRSGEIVFIAVLGGSAHAIGAFIGAFVFSFVKLYAAALLTAWQLVLGLVLIVMVFVAPSGIFGLIEKRLRAKPAPAQRGAA